MLSITALSSKGENIYNLYYENLDVIVINKEDHIGTFNYSDLFNCLYV